eukprot:6083722-Ditylum_brightwellii.AAC.1
MDYVILGKSVTLSTRIATILRGTSLLDIHSKVLILVINDVNLNIMFFNCALSTLPRDFTVSKK